MACIYGTAHFQLHAHEHRIVSECLFFSCTLLKLACSNTQLVCLITELACSKKFVDRHGFTGVFSSFNSSGMHCEYVMSSNSLLRVHTSHYLSSSNSPVNIRIGKHIRKGRGFILLVTGPAVINHLSANYTEFYFC